jgi:DNA-binding transcriptional MerR regulator
MTQPTRVFSPGEAASTLGVTTQSLRRYAQYYGEVFDEVPQHAGQRVFTEEIVERLAAAQALQQANKAPSIKAALELVRNGASEALERLEQPSFEAAVLDRLEQLTAAVARLQEGNRALAEQLRALEPPKDEPDRLAVLEEANADLERRNRYLMTELERRRLELEKPRRPPRWQFWRRRQE